MEDQIREFFEKRGIVRQDSVLDVGREFKRQVYENMDRFDAPGFYQKGIKMTIDGPGFFLDPKYCDLAEQVPDFYDFNLKFLPYIADKISAEIQGKEHMDIIHPGCKSGIHVAFLAEHFKDAPITFHAYDNREEMVAKAKENCEGLGIDFKVRTHTPGADDVLGDMQFSRYPIFRAEAAPKRMAEVIERQCQNMKEGASYVMGGIVHKMPEGAIKRLEDVGIQYVAEDLIIALPPEMGAPAMNVYAHTFKK